MTAILSPLTTTSRLVIGEPRGITRLRSWLPIIIMPFLISAACGSSGKSGVRLDTALLLSTFLNSLERARGGARSLPLEREVPGSSAGTESSVLMEHQAKSKQSSQSKVLLTYQLSPKTLPLAAVTFGSSRWCSNPEASISAK